MLYQNPRFYDISYKGIRGEYALSMAPSDITIYDILNALDTAVLEDMDFTSSDGEGELRCAVNELLKEFTRSKTLSEFMKDCESRIGEGWDMYVI